MTLPYSSATWGGEGGGVPAPVLEKLVHAVWIQATRRPKVLLCIEDEALRDECRRVLVRALFTVVEPPGAGLTDKVMLALLPDAVVADVRTLDGWGEVRRLKESPLSRMTPVVGLVDAPRETDRMWARRLELACLVPLPFDPDGLLEVMERITQG